MPYYMKNPKVVEVLTFEELMDYGIKNGANIVNGMPWSFTLYGYPVTHENDDLYLVTTDSIASLEVHRGSVLVLDKEDKNMYVISKDELESGFKRL